MDLCHRARPRKSSGGTARPRISAIDDVNPPVHAWSALRVYEISGARGQRDRQFLESVFQKLLLNFTGWVNRKDARPFQERARSAAISRCHRASTADGSWRVKLMPELTSA
jgi:hypothetical protein